MARPLPSRPLPLRIASAVLTIAVLAVALRVVYGPGYLGVDAMWSLAWAEDLLEHAWLTPSITTTPHVLSNLLGVLLLPFGNDADRALITLQFLGAGALVWFVAAAARAIAGIPAALLAGLLMLTQEQLLFATRAGFLDVFAAMIVAAAGWIAVRGGRHRWLGAGVLLALAGLLRPEPWVLLGVLALWRWRKDSEFPFALAALVVLVPVIWAVTDLVLNDDALYSLHQTRAASERFRTLQGLNEGLPQRLVSVPKSVFRAAGPAGTVLGLLTMLLAFWPGARGTAVRARWFGVGEEVDCTVAYVRLLLGGALVLGVTVAAEAVTGTLLFARFSLPCSALVVAAGVSGLVLVVRARVSGVGRSASAESSAESRSLPAFAAAGVVLLVLAAPLLIHARHITDPEHQRYADARAILRPGVPCRPLVVPTAEIRPAAAVWTDVWAGDVVDALDEGVPESGSFVDATTKDGQLFSHGGWTTVKVPDLGALPLPVVREANGWVLKAGDRQPTANTQCGR